ncbi:MAG: N-acetyltransferase [Sphingobacteriaceae bacterium]|nr:MAG: N-acetyltransferase [Sphingobacteriaceae bacterium]
MNIAYKRITSLDTELISLIADWYFTEWGIDKTATIKRLTGFPSNGIQFQMVMTLDGIPIATGGIYEHVGILEAVPRLKVYHPWLALVYTMPEHRGEGYGALLCEEIQAQAKSTGTDMLYLFTHTAESLYKRLGWEEMERIALKGKDIAIMKKEL